MDELKFNVTMKVADMYRFLMRHAYSGISGIVNIIISGGALILLFAGVGESMQAKVMLGIVAALFTVIDPIYLYYKAAKQVKLSPMFSKPLEYCINRAGITVSQGEEFLEVGWQELRKAVETRKDYYLYLSLTRAYIFPKRELGGMQQELKKMVSEQANPKICKFKWRKAA